MSGATVTSVYEQAWRHGLSHERALDCVERGKVDCWCGNPRVCVGGAQRFVGCPITPDDLKLWRWPRV